ncbi:hypothetical protein [Frankia sp. R82]|uniref:hypothetical protein n=1 Tax=Frankia sp. R82 TaxID=2950553 RepID=UPI002043BFAC|nr:hypothetical protein [Frankia sp. R82]MCM3884817.1 hypothetical protein [Frankia sp. R82]
MESRVPARRAGRRRPPSARQRLGPAAHGYAPVNAWLDQQLTDIVLNRGRVMVTPELLARITEVLADD